MPEFNLGELRHTSAGNVFRLEEFYGRSHVGVRRVAIIGDEREALDLWDHDIVYRWSLCQWESIPLVGEDTSEYPQFGVFAP